MHQSKKLNKKDEISTALAAVALQDHLVRSLKMGGQFELNARWPSKRAISKQHRSGLSNTASKFQGCGDIAEREYVLDRRPTPLTLAQRLGLVEAPPSQLTEAEWRGVKNKATQRHDFQQPCVICKDDLGLKEHVLLSCTHVFHKSCLQAFERFTGKKTCPMCRKEQYQTRVVHDGKIFYKDKSATIIQAAWRGYVVRTLYKKLREMVPPKDVMLRKKFYEEKLKTITDRMVRSLDCDVAGFCSEMDRDLEASRNVFRQFDDTVRTIGEDQWQEIITKAIERDFSDCSICLTALNCASCPTDFQHGSSEVVLAKENPFCNSRSLATKNMKSAAAKATVKSPNISKQKNRNSQLSASSGRLGSSMEENKTVKQKASLSNNNSNEEDGRCQEVVSDKNVTMQRKPIVILSCSHAFHKTCLEALEEFAVTVARFVCPICRAFYQKRILDWETVHNL